MIEKEMLLIGFFRIRWNLILLGIDNIVKGKFILYPGFVPDC
jgi:hypothetical protein